MQEGGIPGHGGRWAKGRQKEGGRRAGGPTFCWILTLLSGQARAAHCQSGLLESKLPPEVVAYVRIDL